MEKDSLIFALMNEPFHSSVVKEETERQVVSMLEDGQNENNETIIQLIQIWKMNPLLLPMSERSFCNYLAYYLNGCKGMEFILDLEEKAVENNNDKIEGLLKVYNLDSWKKLKKENASLQKEAKRKKNDILSIKSIRTDKEKIENAHYTQEDKMLKALEIEEEYIQQIKENEKRMKKLEDEKNLIERWIESLPADEQEQAKTWLSTEKPVPNESKYLHDLEEVFTQCQR
jgi:hypothetical protein